MFRNSGITGRFSKKIRALLLDYRVHTSEMNSLLFTEQNRWFGTLVQTRLLNTVHIINLEQCRLSILSNLEKTKFFSFNRVDLVNLLHFSLVDKILHCFSFHSQFFKSFFSISSFNSPLIKHYHWALLCSVYALPFFWKYLILYMLFVLFTNKVALNTLNIFPTFVILAAISFFTEQFPSITVHCPFSFIFSDVVSSLFYAITINFVFLSSAFNSFKLHCRWFSLLLWH